MRDARRFFRIAGFVVPTERPPGLDDENSASLCAFRKTINAWWSRSTEPLPSPEDVKREGPFKFRLNDDGLARFCGKNLIGPEYAFPQNALERRSSADEVSSGQDGLMNIINREELKQKLDQRGEFTLVNCLDEWMFREKRIPGSIRFEKAFFQTLNPKGEIIVYCSNPGCTASVLVYHQFVEHGFQNVWHYPGGIADWEDSGYPMEGERFH